MALDTISTDGELVAATTAVLRYYIVPYHLQYPQLLAEGLSPRDIGAKLDKHPDIVAFHLGRLFDKVPTLKRHPNRADIIARALAERERLGTVEPPPVAESPRTFIACVPRKLTPADGPSFRSREKSPSRSRLLANRTSRIKRALTYEATFRIPPGLVLATQDELVQYIHKLAPAHRRILDIVMRHDTLPPIDTVIREYGGKEVSAKAVLASAYSQLHLGTPRGIKGGTLWFENRFNIIKEAYHSGKVQPPREARQKQCA